MSLVVILGVISIALALAYTSMRTQSTAVRIQSNASRQTAARLAAYAGISAGLQKMHGSQWGGVRSTLSGTISDSDSYQVSFATGDASLNSADPDWNEFPYRVTLTSIGYSTDPANPSIRATHRVRAVAQLVRRKLSDAPASWTDLQQYTIHQWSDRTAYVELPFRAAGRVHLQGPLSLFQDYPYKSKPFHGAIDEVAIFEKALSTDEVDEIYDAARGSGDYEGPADALGTLYAQHSPTAWWRLNETGTATRATDAAGGHDGDYAGAKPGTAGAPNGVTNYAARFDGVNDYIDVGTLDVNGSAMTILAWFKADSFGFDDGRIISKAYSPSNDHHFWMLSTIRSNGEYRLRFRLRTGSSTTTLIASGGNLNAGVWIFAAAVYDGTTMKLYMNGNEVGSTSKSGSIARNADIPVYIGDNPPGSTRARYLRDLVRIKADGGGDYRTFEGPVEMPSGRTSDEARGLLADDLELQINTVAASNSAPVYHPQSAPLTYQLYPGGATYDASEIFDSALANVVLQPDVHSNPLGVFYRYGGLRVLDNVSIEGTLVVDGSSSTPDLLIEGENVKLAAAAIPSLNDEAETIKLPVALVRDDIQVYDDSASHLDGTVLAGDDFEIYAGHDTVQHQIQGHLLTHELKIRKRYEWDRDWSWWLSQANQFLLQLRQPSATSYFPTWLEQQHGFVAQPQLQVKPPASGSRHHWHDWQGPLFVPHPDDPGLRWDLVEWTDDL